MNVVASVVLRSRTLLILSSRRRCWGRAAHAQENGLGGWVHEVLTVLKLVVVVLRSRPQQDGLRAADAVLSSSQDDGARGTTHTADSAHGTSTGKEMLIVIRQLVT